MVAPKKTPRRASAAEKLDLRLAGDWDRLSEKHSVKFTLIGERFDAEWSPARPTSAQFWAMHDAYLAARHVFLTEMARKTGGQIICIDLPRRSENV